MNTTRICGERVPSGLYVGISCTQDLGHPGPHKTDGGVEWTVVDKPMYPEVWIIVWRNGAGASWPDEERARSTIKALDPDHSDAIGILHLHPDGTTTMEAP